MPDEPVASQPGDFLQLSGLLKPMRSAKDEEDLKETPMRAQAGMKNVGTTERILRVVLGGALAVWALWLLFGGGTVLWVLLYVALIALGIDFVVTGLRGYCPLYKRLGWSTARPQLGGQAR